MKNLKTKLGKLQKEMLIHAFLRKGLFSIAKCPATKNVAESLENRGLLTLTRHENASWQAEITEKGKFVALSLKMK